MGSLRLRLRPLVILLAALAMLAFVASEADARAGGGRSSGSRGTNTFSAPPATRTAPNTAAPMERSMTQPGQPGALSRQATPAGQPGGMFGGLFNRPGLLGGLAAGFLGAGLLGLLFGHGLLGGLGGIASLFGLLLQIGLVVIVASLLWRWWQRRQQPATAGGPSLRDINGGQGSGLGGQGSALGSFGFGGGSAPTPVRELNIEGADFDAFERLLGEIQTAYSNEDLNAIRSRATAEMASYFAEDLDANASRGVVNRISDVKLLQGDLAEAWREDGAEYATVAMRFALKDKMADRSSGRIVEGSDELQEATELWTFRRVPGGQWLLSAIQQS
jgi:predicted lipid-binding transport protein (Tim44 family)